MNKTLKLALLPAAVASAMFANNALAGTEACFEVYKGTDAFAVAAHDTIYTGAACIAEASRLGATATDLAPTTEGKVAYELTGDLTVNLNALDGVDTDQHIVYIPTTDVPGGTKIEMEITGATFEGNSNQIHLVKYDEVAADNSFIAVASSDGTVDGTSTVTFLTKAGTTISAGTRLAFSLVSTGAASTAVVPVGLKLENTTCTDDSSTQTVSIRATSAKTDGGTGYDIIGGISSLQTVLDVSPQFYAFQDGTTAEVNVNAESTNDANAPITARAEFVYDSADVANQLVAKRYEAVYKTSFYNRSAVLDRAVALTADDHVNTMFTASSSAGSDVKMALWNSRTAATGVLADQVDAETGTVLGLLDGTSYATEATDLFTPATSADAETNAKGAPSPLAGAAYNEMFYTVTNTAPAAIMNFNYNVEVDHALNFNDTALLDHCSQNLTSHEIGVNGAVLKVPYAYDTASNWVRITNEHSAPAEVTVDVFGESKDVDPELNGTHGTNKKTFTLGTVGSQDSVVYRANDIIAQYKAENGDAAGTRYTFTFTVTAPKNTVHGVSVQAIPNGVDRVMPVLDQNDWSQ